MTENRTMPQWWLPIAGMVLLAFAIGIGGGSLLAPIVGTFFTTPEANAPLEDANNVDRRADLIAGESPGAQDAGETQTAPPPDAASNTASNGDSLTLQPPAQATAPPRGEDTRGLERRLLAIDSPLTPAVTDIAGRILQNRKDRQAAQTQAAQTQAAQTQARSRDETGAAQAAATGTVRPQPTAALQQTDPERSGQPLHVLVRGAVIPAVLQSAIDSALPGLVRAQVSDDVYDSLTGQHILIPRGAKLTGTYGQAGGSGARRLFVVWTDLRMPGYVSGGNRVDLDRFTTLGADGASGLEGRRRTGFWKALGAAVLFDLAGNATAILTNQQAQPESDLGALAGAALGNATSRVATDYIGSLLAQGTRFKVKAGSIMNVLVEQDLSLPAIPAPEVRRP